MIRLIPLLAVLAAFPVQAADREGPRQRERDAAYYFIARHPVTERYRYYVPTFALSQHRIDDPRMHTKWRPQPIHGAIDAGW